MTKNIVIVASLFVALSACSSPAAISDPAAPDDVRVQDYHPNSEWNCKVFTHDSMQGAGIAVVCK